MRSASSLQAVDLILNVGRILGGNGRKHGAQGGKHEQKATIRRIFCKKYMENLLWNL